MTVSDQKKVLEAQLVHLQSLNVSLQQVILGMSVSVTMVMWVGEGGSCWAGGKIAAANDREPE